VQCVGLDPEAAVGRRRDLEFLVAVPEPFRAFAQAGIQRHPRPQRGAGAVAAEEGGECVRVVAAIAAEGRHAAAEVHLREPAIEVQRRAGGLGGIQQRDVEFAAADRPDHLAVVAPVALQVHFAVQGMDHAPAHHHRAFQHRTVGAGLAQGMQAALGQREVDRAAAGVAVQSRIAAAFEHVDAPAALRQQGGEEGAGQPGADDRERPLRFHAPPPRQASTPRTKRRMSAWLL